MNKFILTLMIFLFSLNTAFANGFIEDDLVNETLKNKELKETQVNTNYNYEDTEQIVIKLKPCAKYSTKNALQEGDILNFKVKENVVYNGKVILKRDTIVTARIKTYMTRGYNGIPAQLTIDDFEIEGLNSKKIKSSFTKKGMNMTLFVLPIKWALTPIPFVGSFTNLIIGGHAKLTPKDTVILYYYPNW